MRSDSPFRSLAAFLTSAALVAVALVVGAAVPAQAATGHVISIDTDTVVTADFYGVGVNLIPVSLMPNNRAKGYDEAYWEMDRKRIETLEPAIARVWFQTDWFETEKGVYDFETPEMQAFYAYLDALKAAGTEVEFDYGWKIGRDIQDWYAIPGVDPQVSAPADLDAFAAGASAVLHELIEERGYDNIRYLTFYNEPNGFWDFEAPGSQVDLYEQMARAVHERLIADDRRDLVDIWGPEEWNSVPWTRFMKDRADDVFDAYSFHVYGGSYDSLSTEIANRRDYVAPKPVVMSEFGFSGNYDSWWGSSYGNYVIKSANEGLSGALVWQLNGVWLEDPQEGTDTNGTYTMWDSVLTAKTPNPRFYEAGLLMRYVPEHSQVLAVETDSPDVRATAFRDAAGDYTILVETNESTAPRILTVDFGDTDINATFHRIVSTESVVPEENGLLPASSGQIAAGTSFTDTVDGQRNVIVYTTRDPEVQVAVTPTNAAVTGGSTIDLDADIIDAPEGVTWSVTVGGGTVSGDGLLTAPDVDEPTVVAVRATSDADPTAYGVALIRVAPAPEAGRTLQPEFDLAGGSYTGARSVTIMTASPGATIHYTTDGSAPGSESPVYAAPIELSGTTVLKAIAIIEGETPSATTSTLYRILPAVAGPAPGYVPCATEDQTCGFAGIGTVAYGAGDSYLYGVFDRRVTCSGSVFGGDPAPGVSKRCFVLSSTAEHATKPSISPAGGSYDVTQTVSITSPVPGAEIRYTDNGQMPTASSTLYTGPISVSSSRVIKAIAIQPGLEPSPIAYASFSVIDTSGGPDGFTYCAHQFSTCQLDGAATVAFGLNGSYFYGTFNDDVVCTASNFGGGDPAPNQAKKCWYQTLDASTTLPPVFTPPPGSYQTARSVTISSGSPGAVVHYTLDGSTPTPDSPVFAAPIVVESTTTVKAIATSAGLADSPVVTALYVIGGTTGPNGEVGPTGYSYCSGEFGTCAFSGTAAVAFGANGSFFYGVFEDGALCTASTFGGDPAFNQAKACFFRTIDASTVLPVTFSPGAGTYSSAQEVTLTSATDGATIHYTLDGSTPTTASSVASGPVSVGVSSTISAIAVKTGMTASPLVAATYTIDASTASTPTFSPPGGSYSTGQQVTISAATAGATIHYTTDGSTPTASSPIFSAPIPIASSTTIRAIAVKDGLASSAVASAAYVISVTSGGPEGFTLCADEWQPCAFAGTATVAFGANGSFFYGTFTDGVVCTGSNFGGDPAFNQAKKCYYRLGTGSGAVTAPLITPAGGVFTAPVQVAIGTPTSGATIHYTLDGSMPTTASPVYAGPITVTTTTTVKAVAVKAGLEDSLVVSAAFTIQAEPQGPAGYTFCANEFGMCQLTGLGAVAFGANGSFAYREFTAPVQCIAANFGGDPAPNQAKQCFLLPGGLPATAAPQFDPEGGVFNAPVAVTLSGNTAGSVVHYTTDGTEPTAESPLYAGPVMVTTTTTIRAIAVAPGHAVSAEATAGFVILTPAAAPVFSPPGGTYPTAQTVSMSTSSVGAEIRYTTDGSDPTSASPVYTGPIVVAATTTIRAVAQAGGFSDSEIAVATYEIVPLPVTASPAITPDGGRYTAPKRVTITGPAGAVIHYTIDGSTPTASSPVYTGRFWVTSTTTVRAIAIAPGHQASPVVVESYTIVWPDPRLPRWARDLVEWLWHLVH